MRKYHMQGAMVIGLFLFVSSPQSVFAQTNESNELIIFSSRKEPLIKPVVNLFEKTSGVKVVLKTGKSAALGQQILQELPNPTADIYIAKESGSLEFLRAKGAFQPYQSSSTENIPVNLKATDGSWFGVSGRSRALIYNTNLVTESEVPKTLAELSDPKWKGKIAAVNSGNESFIAWVSALRIQLGEQEAQKILNDLKANDIVLISHSHTDIRKAIGRGEYPLGLINHYYYHLQKKENDQVLRSVGIVYLDQDKDARGEIVNVSGVAIVKGTKHLAAARQFVDFLASPEAQKLFAEINFEYPVVPGVKAHPEVAKTLNCSKTSVLECIHMMDVRLDSLGKEMDETIKLLEKVDWH